MRLRGVASVLLVVGAAAGQTAFAQTTKAPAPAAPGKAAPAPPPPVSADPAMTSATYGDWVLRCQRIGEGDKMQRLCEVVQLIQAQNQRDPIAEIALGRLPHEQALHLTTVLPRASRSPARFSSDRRTRLRTACNCSGGAVCRAAALRTSPPRTKMSGAGAWRPERES